MKKEYELLEKFRTEHVAIQPSLQKPKKSGFKEWTFLEIVGCIFSISLIVYGSYNMIFPPTESESAEQQVQWEADSSKRTDLVSTDQRYKDNYELDQDINKNLLESSSSDKSDQRNSFKKFILGSAEASDANQINVEALAGEYDTQGTAIHSESTSPTDPSTQRTSTQGNVTASTTQSSSTESTQSNSTTSTQRSSTASTQSSSAQTPSQSTQPTRSSNSATYQPRSSSSDYYTYNSYTPSSSSSSPSSSNGSYNTSTYSDSSNSRLVVVQPTNVSNEPGMIAGTP